MERVFRKDEEFNKIGRCWLLWNTDTKKFYDQVNREYDEDLYLMYDHLAYLKKRLNRINDAMINDPIKQDFINFSRAIVNEITNMIYLKEVNEKDN